MFYIELKKGNLDKAIVLGEYSLTHEVASIDGFLTISINVHDEGNVLEIVGVCCKYLPYNILLFKSNVCRGNDRD